MEEKKSNKLNIIIIGIISVVLVLVGVILYLLLKKDDTVNSGLTENIDAVNMAEKTKINLVKVPYAKMEIRATKEITSDMVGFVEVNAEFVKMVDIYQNHTDVVGYYVSPGTFIPEGGLFYKAQVVNRSEIPNIIYEDLKEGYTAFSLEADNHTTYGNSIYPGDKIDMYFKYIDETDQIVFGKIAGNLRVLAVRDNTGKDVFEGKEKRVPAELVIEVDTSMYELFMRASYIKNAKLVPVPKNKKYTGGSGEEKGSIYLRDYILSKSVEIPTN